MLMLTSGNVKEKHWAIGFGCIKLPSISQVLCRRNGPWKWLDAVEVLQISCVSYCPWWIISVPRKPLNFKKVPTIMSLTTTRYKPLNTTEGSLSLISPFTLYLPTNEKPHLVWFLQQQLLFIRIHFEWCWLFRPQREGSIMPCFWLISKKMSAILLRLFVSLFVCLFFLLLALLFVQNVSLSWWMYCAVTTCLRLYGFAVSMFGGKKGRRDRNPGLKKKKISSILYTM